ncbi:MAG: hypothetical protein ACI3V0_05300 [Faecousia sp.]
MEDKNELEEFDLDDILSEFHASPDIDESSAQDIETLPDNLEQLLEPWDAEQAPQTAEPEAESTVSMDTGRLNDLIAQLSDSPEMTGDAAGEEPAESEGDVQGAPMDTIRMNDLINEIMQQKDTPQVSDEETIRMDAITEDATIQLDMVSDAAARSGEDVPDGETIRMDTVAEEPAAEVPKEEPAPQIIYNPRTRLRELKKKLVAGPEKRYYELSEMGIGRIQISIVLNLVLVVLCIITTTLFSLNMIPENRLRFVIFSQILSMLLSAYLGCGQMLDGLGDLLKGRFTINTMLSLTFIACCVDAVFCLSELRIPCCAAFSLEITMALWARYQRHSTEMAQMDSMRKAVRLHAIVKEPAFYEGKAGILRRDGEVEDFMDQYAKRTGPELVQSIYCMLSLLVCIAISVFAGIMHGSSLAIQILSTSLLVAVPASFFVSLSRPAALLERRLHMVGTVLCGWQGVKGLCGKAAFPLRDEDLFPQNTTKLNGVKFYGDRDPDTVVSYTTSLIYAAGGSLEPVFRKMLESRNGVLHHIENFHDYGSGGIGGEVCGEPVLMGTLDFLQDMGVEIPEGTMVNQAVYASIDGQLCAVFAISYAKMRSSAAGIISLCSNRKITPVLIGCDFMLTDSLLRAKFNVNTRRIRFPDQEQRSTLSVYSADPETSALALATRDDLAGFAYAVSGARALRTSCCLGVAIHLVGGILGMLIMAALAYLGTTELLTPSHVLLYQLVWMIPGLLITEWTRTV